MSAASQEMSTASTQVTPLAALRKHWVPALVLTLLLAVLGAGVGALREPTYTGEARLAVGAGELSTLAIPGFPTASEDLASSYARWVTAVGVGEMTLPEATMSLSASPIPESNVIRIEATSKVRDVAVESADAAAAQLIEEIDRVERDNDPDVVLREVNSYTEELTRLSEEVARTKSDYEVAQRGRLEEQVSEAEVEAKFEDYVDAQVKLDTENLEQAALQERYRRIVSDQTTEADLRSIGQGAVITDNDRASTAQFLGIVGFGAGVFVSLVASTVYERRRSRQDG